MQKAAATKAKKRRKKPLKPKQKPNLLTFKNKKKMSDEIRYLNPIDIETKAAKNTAVSKSTELNTLTTKTQTFC
jgi:hypothetical protein